MRSATPPSRRLQLAFKIIAIGCGIVLLLAAAHTGSQAMDFATFSSFVANQIQSTSQLQWLFGLIFLSAGIFFVPVMASKQRTFIGDRDLSNDSYVLYLIDKYQIEKNLVLDQHTACDKIFSSINDALAYVHLIECPITDIVAPVSTISAAESSVVEEGQQPPTSESIEAETVGLKNPFLNVQHPADQVLTQTWGDARRLKVSGILGAILFTVVLGGLYYANSNSVRYTPKPIAPITPVLPVAETPNSDQVVAGTIPNQEVTSTNDAKETLKPLVSTPINERWIGTWTAESAKLKLSVTANTLILNGEEFTWTGTRPKGVVQCCLAFYEGSTNKSDLLARIAGAQDSGVTLKPEAQKTLALVNSLGEGNFKRIVFADPYLKKYFFIYDQNFVYRISRDLGDKVDVVIEQLKKQE